MVGERAKLRAVIFDIDGTLSDWEAAVERAMSGLMPEVPASEAETLPQHLWQAIREQAFVLRDGLVVDRRYWLLLADPVPIWSAALPATDPHVTRTVAEKFRELLEPVAYADAAPCLRNLRGKYLLGVLTNSPRADATIDALGLASFFDAVVFPGEERRKPAPEAFLAACERMRVKPGEAAYIGDSISHDVEGAIAAGLRAVWVDRHGDNYTPPAGAVRIASLADLPLTLDKLSGHSAAAR